MSSTSSPILACDVHSRHTEPRVAALALIVSGLVPYIAGLSAPIAIPCSLAAVLLAWLGLRRAGWLAADHRLVAVSWSSDGRWLLTDRCGRTVEGHLRTDSRVGSSAVWLRWQVAGRPGFKCRSLLLVRGDIPDGDLRRLVVRLRLDGRNAADDTSQTGQPPAMPMT